MIDYPPGNIGKLYLKITFNILIKKIRVEFIEITVGKIDNIITIG